MSKISKEVANALQELKNEIKADLKVFRETMDRGIPRELRKTKASLTFIDAKYDEVTADLKSVLEQNKQLRAEIFTLKERCDWLEMQVKASEPWLVDCEQYSRKANVEIKGMPVRDKKNLFDILTELGKWIDEPIAPCDVDVFHRVPVPNDQTSKTLSINSFTDASAILFLRHLRKGADCAQLGLTDSNSIFINEHSCPEPKRLLGQGIAKQREAGWKFVRVRNGNIYARKFENSSALKICSESDLVKMT